MITEELIAYIQQELALGLTPEELIGRLWRSGWNEEDINKAISIACHPQTKQYTTKPINLWQKTLNECNTLLHSSYDFYRSKFGIFLLVQLIAMGVSLIAIGFSFLSLFNIHILPGIILTIRLLLVLFLSYSNLVLLLATCDDSGIISSLNYYKKAVRLFGRYLCLILIPGAAVIIAINGGGFILQMMVNLLEPYFSLIILVRFLIMLVGVVVGYFIFAPLFFAPWVFVSENKGIIESLKQSRFYLIDYVPALFLHQFIIGSFFIINIIPIIGQIIVYLLIIPLVNIYFYKLYQNRRLIKNKYVK